MQQKMVCYLITLVNAKTNKTQHQQANMDALDDFG
jgi:hypothetical protein